MGGDYTRAAVGSGEARSRGALGASAEGGEVAVNEGPRKCEEGILRSA
jgi:hypothetical protein